MHMYGYMEKPNYTTKVVCVVDGGPILPASMYSVLKVKLCSLFQHNAENIMMLYVIYDV